MSEDAQLRGELIGRIKEKKAQVSAFARNLNASSDRQTNTSIICGAVAAVLTAGPALGGTGFTEGLGRALALPSDSIVWRTLCFAATILSLVATISTNMWKSRDNAGRLSKAEACGAELEGLEAMIEFGQLPVNEGVKLYQQYIAQVPFLTENS
jgi:hypothetical protein